uniref:Uncharacterized protein n=1 Tax=Arundo donax TaxID=35708 RepID=A0A0A9FF21_ARUDO
MSSRQSVSQIVMRWLHERVLSIHGLGPISNLLNFVWKILGQKFCFHNLGLPCPPGIHGKAGLLLESH